MVAEFLSNIQDQSKAILERGLKPEKTSDCSRTVVGL